MCVLVAPTCCLLYCFIRLQVEDVNAPVSANKELLEWCTPPAFKKMFPDQLVMKNLQVCIPAVIDFRAPPPPFIVSPAMSKAQVSRGMAGALIPLSGGLDSVGGSRCEWECEEHAAALEAWCVWSVSSCVEFDLLCLRQVPIR